MDYQPLYTQLKEAGAGAWAEIIPDQLEQAFDCSAHGTFAKWQQIIDQLSLPVPTQTAIDTDTVQIGSVSDISDLERAQLEQQLKEFHPWRKGPYDIFGLHINTEWRSDWKWERLKAHLAPLRNRLVLDVGCGNGYHCWRMLGEHAKMVVGIDPSLLSVMQFHLLRKLHGDAPVYVLPVGIEQMPQGMKAFDTVFSMGVLYHRRSPIDHLMELRDCLRPDGELVLETLVIDGGLGEALMPEDRYAKMRNVWFIPSCDTLVSWMQRCGFKNIRVVDVTVTTTEEQRTTEWMTFYSLNNFLDADDKSLTCEGLPAPKRAIVIAST